MGLFDKLTGTKRPSGGVEPRPAHEVRAALLDLCGSDVPYVIRDGTPEGVDLVAEWKLKEPAWRNFFIRSQLSRAIEIRMRLVPENHEVRALDRMWEVDRIGNMPVSKRYVRGPANTKSLRWSIGRGADGRLEATETFRFDTAELKDPLRDTVLKAGWTWRGVILGQP
ncbi:MULTISPECIES: hypothetical protein [Streptomyces]|uniref:Uncharacterized protein n=1 Tax=Streptomyces himastatinicus ATCC 53653 TaxID=457427 RepID=D9WCX7_9ACTN|nr:MULTISPECIES: hypothetical protein [Streptomyces]EFL23056.1 conserved hypothetical protein [Streptomyces himastatinicus ATCC 53653]